MPGVANTTIGPGLSMYERSNGWTTTHNDHNLSHMMYCTSQASYDTDMYICVRKNTGQEIGW